MGKVDTAAARVIRDINALGLSPKYDAACKQVLSIKSILAWILKWCVAEYKDCKIVEIESCIEPRQISTVSVLSGSTPEMIQGSNVEDKTLGEKPISFDIFFRAKLPGVDDELGLIINVEAQNVFNTSYPIEYREEFYVSRLISAEHDRDIGHLEYKNLKRVYSIWIFTTPPQERRNTISWLHLNREFLVGSFDEPVKKHELLNIIEVYIGSSDDKNYDGLLRMLSVLFAPVSEVSESEKMRILSEDYGIQMTREDKEAFNTMCNLSEGIFAKGEVRGEARGRANREDEMIRNMLAEKLPLDMIARISGKPLDYVQSF